MMTSEKANRASGAAIGFIIVSVIFAALTVGLIVLAKPAAIDADRAAIRSQALAQMRVDEEKALATAAIIDAKHGTVRLPIETAMTLAAKQWQNPAAARADLNARAEKSVAPVKTESFE